MKKYLVKLDSNYADEFDIYGSAILDQEQLDDLLLFLESDKDKEFYFGTNESVEVSEGDINYQEISDADIKVLEKYQMDEVSNSDILIAMIDRFHEEDSESNE